MVNSEGVHFYFKKYGTKSSAKHRRFYVVFEKFARDFYSQFVVCFLVTVTVCFQTVACNLCSFLSLSYRSAFHANEDI